jgi:hypothetical protein
MAEKNWFTEHAPKAAASQDWFAANAPKAEAAPAQPDLRARAELEETAKKENAPIAGTYRKIGRGAALGAFEGLGIPESASGMGVVAGALGSAGSGLYEAGKNILMDPIEGTMKVLHGMASGVEKSGGEAYHGLREHDPEKFGHGAGSLIAQLFALKSGKEAATTKLAESPVLKAAEKTPAGKLVKDLSKSKVSELQEAHAAESAKVEQAYQKDLKAHKESVQSLKAEHEQAMREFKSAEEMKRHQQNLATTVRDNIQLADKRIAQKLGDEFNAVHDAIEKKNPKVQVQDVERTARAELFFPDSVQAFNNIMENFKSKLGMSDYGILRKTYTRMNELLFGGKELPTDLYAAVKTVRDSLGKDLQKAATSVGMGERFSRTMKKWGEYQSDWHDTSALAKGGSPLSRILHAEDPQFVIDQLSGKSAERLLSDLKKYGTYGADSGLAQRLQQFTKRLKSTPTPKSPEQPRIPAAPEKPTTQPFDREAAARKLLVDRIKKGLGIGGGVVGGEILYKLLSGGGGNSKQAGGFVP